MSPALLHSHQKEAGGTALPDSNTVPLWSPKAEVYGPALGGAGL